MTVTKTFGDLGVSVVDDLVATAEIRRAPDNFFDSDLITSLADAYFWLDDRDDCRAIVLCADGKHFCAGADLAGRSRQPNAVTSGVNTLYQQATRLFDAKTPVVAAVQGAAIGGGLGLACSADFRVASPLARFAANFARLGFHQGFGMSYGPRPGGWPPRSPRRHRWRSGRSARPCAGTWPGGSGRPPTTRARSRT